VDCANLLGKVGHEDAARKLHTVRDALAACGHIGALFLEHRAYTWFMHHQDSEVKAEAFKRFVADANVSLVQGESDLAMLQCARQIPGSVCVSDDGFADYRNVFGDIVGTSRVRSFSWAKINNNLYLSIEGLADAIVIRQEGSADPMVEPSDVPKGVTEAPSPDVPEDADMADTLAVTDVTYPPEPTEGDTATCRRPDAPSSHEDLLSLGATMLAKGAEKKAIVCFAKAAKKDPHVWAELAWMYHDGNGVKADKSKARRFFRKAREMAAKKRQCRIRRARARLLKNRLFGLVTLRGCAA
jgi:hypothetical protein